MPVQRPGLGEVFAGRFELRGELVETRVGMVYRAYDRDVDETVALLIVDDAAKAAGAVEPLRERVRLARRVTHRNISRAYDLSEYEGRYCLSIEYIDGVRLGEWMTTQPSLAAIVDVAVQLGDGLAAAHAVDVVHCNLAPSCVMVEGSGRAVIGNFGVARFEAAETVAQISARGDDLLRSAAYLAPEQVLGQPPTAAADVYALGLLIFEMLTGAPRFAGEHAVAVASARLDDTLEDLVDERKRDPRIPPALAQLLASCLDREPSERASTSTVAATLRRIKQQLAVGGEAGLAGDRGIELPRARPHGSLAVLPFRYRGPRESDYLAEALLDELVDLLSQTSGLRVLATGATAHLTGAGDRDPRWLGEQLGVDVIVDGTIMLAGPRLRISARLLEVADGFQLWHERFEGGFADVFELQDRLAKRIAEALRVELDIIAHRASVDVAAVESYLRARQAHLRWRTHGPDGAVAHYRAALELAPEFKPALAHLAMALMLGWFQARRDARSSLVPRLRAPGGSAPQAPPTHALLGGFQPREDDGTNWAAEAERAVERALALAPELPETRLAASNLAFVRGEFRDGMLHVNEALRIAPTFALAHEFLGRILLEVGAVAQGTTHLELAVELDPALSYCYADLARCCVYAGDLAGFDDYAARLRARLQHHIPSAAMLHMRVGAWTGSEELIRQGLSFLPEDDPRTNSLRGFGLMLLAPPDELALERHHAQQLARASSPRMQTLVEQLIAEQAAYHGDDERALAHVRAASELVLIDLEWLERCPLLEPLRARPEFQAVHTKVRLRCEKIWQLIDKERGR